MHGRGRHDDAGILEVIYIDGNGSLSNTGIITYTLLHSVYTVHTIELERHF